ncbi:cryptochrome/photolyase family protein [Ulvibacter litoralis]|uniref:Deoxyribodipyrimidine photo-lyase n=1 Tax=Ulvibacter litoralis TaxID=227084 RepID=A0A1G7F6I5_9FLAO|nr:deoxyribodipyrimidine photo-lyase [Ulvibacter litoralis]GHC52498.1 deoxyribodipyrimidine photo-lyase [Ulvibacter litoralis]SDE71406.1 deoxyribodipyrimidine photo-lyase [Ulvibacter litoralis]
MKQQVTVFWFRRDLRLEDNVGLFEALQKEAPVLPIFIFDSNILNELPKDDARITFIYQTLQKLQKSLQEFGSSLSIFYGNPIDVFKRIITEYTVENVFFNHDYEQYAIERDTLIKSFLIKMKITYKTYKDHVIFEKDEVVKADKSPYIVYTPYMKLWKKKFSELKTLKPHTLTDLPSNFLQLKKTPTITLKQLGLEESTIKVADYDCSSDLIQHYKETRDYPLHNTSNLGPHLRFGTVSIRNIVLKAASETEEVFLNELIWREFFIQILWHFPKTVTDAFKPAYDYINWRNNETEFNHWKAGTTGYPLVDAGMRQLAQTGTMHNRVRMVVASFLCKHLLIDWRWGEAYFAEKLLDYEQASNVGNWQWAAGSGVDAAPYFRIFNPTTQLDKFDKDRLYVKKWVEEYGTETYPQPIVDHKEARERCLSSYKKALN